MATLGYLEVLDHREEFPSGFRFNPCRSHWVEPTPITSLSMIRLFVPSM